MTNLSINSQINHWCPRVSIFPVTIPGSPVHISRISRTHWALCYPLLSLVHLYMSEGSGTHGWVCSPLISLVHTSTSMASLGPTRFYIPRYYPWFSHACRKDFWDLSVSMFPVGIPGSPLYVRSSETCGWVCSPLVSLVHSCMSERFLRPVREYVPRWYPSFTRACRKDFWDLWVSMFPVGIPRSTVHVGRISGTCGWVCSPLVSLVLPCMSERFLGPVGEYVPRWYPLFTRACRKDFWDLWVSMFPVGIPRSPVHVGRISGTCGWVCYPLVSLVHPCMSEGFLGPVGEYVPRWYPLFNRACRKDFWDLWVSMFPIGIPGSPMHVGKISGTCGWVCSPLVSLVHPCMSEGFLGPVGEYVPRWYPSFTCACRKDFWDLWVSMLPVGIPGSPVHVRRISGTCGWVCSPLVSPVHPCMSEGFLGPVGEYVPHWYPWFTRACRKDFWDLWVSMFPVGIPCSTVHVGRISGTCGWVCSPLVSLVHPCMSERFLGPVGEYVPRWYPWFTRACRKDFWDLWVSMLPVGIPGSPVHVRRISGTCGEYVPRWYPLFTHACRKDFWVLWVSMFPVGIPCSPVHVGRISGTCGWVCSPLVSLVHPCMSEGFLGPVGEYVTRWYPWFTRACQKDFWDL